MKQRIPSFDDFLVENILVTKHTVISANVNNHNVDITLSPIKNEDIGFFVTDAYPGTDGTYISGIITTNGSYSYFKMISVEPNHRRKGWATSFYNYLVKEWPIRFNKKFQHSNVQTSAGNAWAKTIDESELLERSFPLSDSSFVKLEMNKHKNELIGKGYGNLEIEQILNKIFSKYDIQFEIGFGTPAFEDSANVGIVNAAIDDYGHVHIHYKDYFYETFNDDYYWNDLIGVLSRTIAHERTHLHQLNQIRNGRTLSDYYEILSKVKTDTGNRYKYLSNKQEIMAFAVEAVEEFRSLDYSDDEILKKMKTPFKDNVESNIFYLYTDYFDYTGDWMDATEKKKMKDVIDKFLMYMYQYITKDSTKL